jgi:hypothetical protein
VAKAVSATGQLDVSGVEVCYLIGSAGDHVRTPGATVQTFVRRWGRSTAMYSPPRHIAQYICQAKGLSWYGLRNTPIYILRDWTEARHKRTGHGLSAPSQVKHVQDI